MCPSTAKPTYVAKIRIPFMDGDRETASIWLATRSDRQVVSEHPMKTMGDSAENVIFTSQEKDLDDDHPLIVYTGSDKSIAPIQLIEDREYEIALDIPVSCNQYAAFPFLIEHTDTISLDESLLQKGPDKVYSLSFMSYVGRGFFDLVIDGKRYSIPFEVRSSKIGYRSDYPAMLADIAEFSTGMLLDRKTPLFNYYDVSDDRSENRYEDFLVLEHIFSNMHFSEMYGYVRHDPYNKAETCKRSVPVELAGYVDSRDLMRDVRADNLTPMKGGPVEGRYVPRTLHETRVRREYDTPENRLVKDLVLSIHHMAHDMLDALPEDANDYIRSELTSFVSETDSMSSDSWLRDIGSLERIPFDSPVLQHRHGYSELFLMYQILGLGVMFRQYDTRDLLEGHNRKISKVYEYWCYTRLFKCLGEMSMNKPGPEDARIPGSGDWTVNRKDNGKNGTEFIIPREGSMLSVKLYYNREFTEQDDVFCSYSLKLRPDYTLLITNRCDNRRFIVNFDAKYRMKVLAEKRGPWDKSTGSEYREDDLYKMHTYRDALMQSCGSYILYPGSQFRKFVKKERDVDFNLREGNTIPSVGAIPLIPCSEGYGELQDHIEQVLDRISGIIEGCEYMDPDDYLNNHQRTGSNFPNET